MATNEQTMAWMMDTYSMQRGYAVPEIVTGKPISIGGSVFRHEATGAGVVMVVERACDRLGWPLAEQRCVVQGFGNVGGDRGRRARRAGATVVAVSDISGGIYDAERASTSRRSTRGRASTARSRAARRASDVTNAELLELAVRHARARRARGSGHGRERAAASRRGSIAEGANGPTSIEADEILAERGIPVLPDVLTNAGGVTVSYFEWVQDLGRLFWTRDEIRAKLAEKLADAFDRVWDARRRSATCAAHRGARRRDPRGRRARSRRAGSTRERRVRDAMVSEPRPLLDGSATAQEAGRRARSTPEVRAVLVTATRGGSSAS